MPDEGPGHAADWLAAHGHSLTFTRLFEADPAFPALAEFDGLLILGGAMSVHDEAKFPWLREEKAFIKEVLRAGKVTLAICLGAQLVAQELGAEVRPNAEPEIGFWTVRFSAKALEHPLLRGWPEKAGVLHWHVDTFTVPPGAIRVGMSAGCATQGFVWGDGIIGLQFHPEFTVEMVEKLMQFENHEAAEEQEFVQTAEQIRAKLKSVWKGRKLLESLLANLVAVHEGEMLPY
ncbi:type 1 glutamine amidotransferase [Hymenobacter sp. BT770]|uniref:type 1 glutamine amidotransferase n=1 Tax=Hymenobacter sp. BT770 TaxID=2886942 RepID=UPI001D114503|nr:type 1 glutamine amidotransferase [Hymenobacter sp. BT770]MCC3152236.1 type 1 glutamine amidotransferase [Hymenobacter sp. BT770]MDO3414050.1 type 1 glutamine amidotransferase [Hymenobacter sp. BT770]